MTRCTWPLDRERSALVGRKTTALNKECWSNALRAASMAKLLDLGTLEYVEGWVVGNELPIPMSHAWLRDPITKTIIDPTPVYHESEAGHTYFPAVSYGRTGLAKVAQEVGIQPFALDDEPDAWHAAYLAAQVWCVGKAGALHLHDHHIGAKERQWIEEAEENPDVEVTLSDDGRTVTSEVKT